MVARLLLATACLVVTLSGCADAPDVDALAGDDDLPAAEGQSADLGAAPQWQVGQWWDHAWTLAGGNTFTVKSIVAESGASGYRLVTDVEGNAIAHATFFLPDLGRMGSDWSMRAGTYEFPWYQFPLADNKTWTAAEENLDTNLQPVSRSVSMTARLVPAAGAVPEHFLIEAREGEDLRARYDYRPDLGWFSSFEGFSADSNGDGQPETYSIVTQSSGAGWTGTWHDAQGDFLLNHFSGVFPAANVVQPNPQGSFTITEAHTHVVAILYAFAAPGASVTELVAPDGQHWESYSVGDPDGNDAVPGQRPYVQVPAVPGEWRLATTGAGGFAAGGGAFAWGITVESGTLTSA